MTSTSVASLSNVNIITEGTNAYGVVLATYSKATMTGGTITTGATGARGVSASGASYVTLQDTVINSYGDGINLSGTSVLAPYRANITVQNGGGLNMSASSTATIVGGTITTILGGNGVSASSISVVNLIDAIINSAATGVSLATTSTGTLNNVNITTPNSIGLFATSTSTATVTGGTITTSGSANHYGMYVAGASVGSMNNVTINTSGYRGLGIGVDASTLSVTGGTITTTGENAHGVYIGTSSTIGDMVNLSNVAIHTSGSGAAGVMLMSTYSSTQTMQITGGTIVSNQSAGLRVNEQTNHVAGTAFGGTFAVTINGGAQITGQTGIYIDSNWLAPDAITMFDVPTAAMVNVDQASVINGGVNIQGSATLALGLNNRSQLNGDTLAGGTTSLTIVATNNSAITGNVTGTDASQTNITLTNSTLTGKTTVSDAATLNLSLFDSGTWYMVDNSTLTNLTTAKTARVNFPAPTAAGNYHTLTVRNNLGGEGGTFAMHTDIAAGKADLLTVGGTASTGAHRITLTNANDNAVTGTESPLLLVQTAGGSATFTGTTSAGVYDYSVKNGAQLRAALNLPETNWYLYREGLNNTARAIIDTTAMLGYDWFYSLDALYLRLGDVRQENLGRANPPGEPQPRLGGDASPYQNTSASGNLWLRARAYRLNADATLSGRPYNEYAYGLTAGADKAFHHDSNTTNAATTLLGAFLDIGRIDRDFSGDNHNGNLANSGNNTGYTNSLSAGLYATYLTQTGWHADLVLKADRYKHHFDTTTADQLPVTGDYSNNALGASLEIGRRVQRADGWWVEPMVQAAYTWLSNATYRTAPANATLGVTVDSTRAAQYRALVRFGRCIANSRWSPYGKFGVVRTALTGGALHIDDGAGTIFVPDCEGWRVEFGAGTSYYINARSQLYFDYEYDRAPHYERPWALNLGYRYGW